MRKTTITLLFTFAMLVGMAVAPSAQVFRWKAGESYEAARIEERIVRQIERQNQAPRRGRGSS